MREAANGGFALVILDRVLPSPHPKLADQLLGQGINCCTVDDDELRLPPGQLGSGKVNLAGFLGRLPGLLNPQPDE